MEIEPKELVEALRHYFDDVPLVLQAADAIEKLLSERDEVNADSWKTAFEVERDEHRWIPVTERLPSWGEDVLISISGFVNVGHLVQTNDDKQYNWFYSGWYHDPCEVTHWMPLPQTPKEEQG